MISVIVPVYNVEPYLPRCIKSILQQTYTDFELLLVDDGSTDSSGAICDEFVEKDSRIRVFHKENGSMSDARNYGLDRTCGEFVAFVDSDDYVGPDYLRILAETQAQFQADMVMLEMSGGPSTGFKFIPSQDARRALSPKEALREIIMGSVSPCDKLFKRTLFDRKRFLTGFIYEDLHTIPYLLEDCRICAHSTSVQYYYCGRKGSVSSTITFHKIKMWNEGVEKLYQYVESMDPEMIDCVIYRYACDGIFVILERMLDSPDYTATAKTFRDRHLDWWKRALHNPYLSLRKKAKVLLILTNVNLYRATYARYLKAKAMLPSRTKR
ncbi:MAG: glycosyltransferase family 2 protein [Oscillospiraceae bacterium]|nr:glycosyltransferase family 2 protein [Oscillospiraceae bacterium]